MESNPINEESYDNKLDDSMNSDMYMNKNDQSRDDEYDWKYEIYLKIKSNV